MLIMNFYSLSDITACLVAIVFRINGPYVPLNSNMTNTLVDEGMYGMQMAALPSDAQTARSHHKPPDTDQFNDRSIWNKHMNLEDMAA